MKQSNLDCLASDTAKSIRVTTTISPKQNHSSRVRSIKLKIKKGDLVFSLTGETKEEIAKALAYLGNEEVAAGGDLAVWSAHGCDSKYLAYLMYSPTMIKAKAEASNGHIIVHESVKKLQEIMIPLPPLAEQRKIVERLEKELSKADELEAKSKRLAALADELFKSELDTAFKNVKGEKVRLGDLEDNGKIQLGRGKIISKQDINNSPGDYPVYSSSAQGDGVFGRYGKYMFDDERITWSIDGGGRLFYRPPCRYSVTNVCGWLKVIDRKIDTRYLHLCLTDAWSKLHYDYIHKAHPSVIRNEYIVTIPSYDIQLELVSCLEAVRNRSEKLKAEAEHLAALAVELRKSTLAETFA